MLRDCGIFTYISESDIFYFCILLSYCIGIKHGFSCINIRQVPWEVLEAEAEYIEKTCSTASIA